MRYRAIYLLPLLVWLGQQALAAPLLLISVDGLHPDYVLKADRYGLKIPHLRGLVHEGTFATGVQGVIPTVTYPSHTTLVTGVSPARHGIISNTTFDPLGRNMEGWYWYAEDIQVQTLWSAAANAGLSTAAVNWPVTVGDTDIKYLLPEFWRASTVDDGKLLRAISHPTGLLARLEEKVGPFIDGNIDTLESDHTRTRFAMEIIEQHHPDVVAVHLIALDGIQHAQGPFVEAAFSTLEQMDRMIGDLTFAMREKHPDAIVAIVSDHGFFATHTAVNLRVSFVHAGLIKLAAASAGAKVVESWDAQIWSGAGVGAVVLRDPNDDHVKARVAELLEQLAKDPRNGIARVLSKTEYASAAAFPNSDFLIEFAPGFYLGSKLDGEILTAAPSKGTHGYRPDHSEMHASLFLSGRGISKGRDLGVIDMRQIAPTLASILGVRLPDAQVPALDVFRGNAEREFGHGGSSQP